MSPSSHTCAPPSLHYLEQHHWPFSEGYFLSDGRAPAAGQPPSLIFCFLTGFRSLWRATLSGSSQVACHHHKARYFNSCRLGPPTSQSRLFNLHPARSIGEILCDTPRLALAVMERNGSFQISTSLPERIPVLEPHLSRWSARYVFSQSSAGRSSLSLGMMGLTGESKASHTNT